jgi:hypothetical protein
MNRLTKILALVSYSFILSLTASCSDDEPTNDVQITANGIIRLDGNTNNPNAQEKTLSLSWTPPELNTDGSQIQDGDLTGYRIYHGSDANALNNIIEIQSAGSSFDILVNTQNIPNVPRYFIAMSAISRFGLESARTEPLEISTE